MQSIIEQRTSMMWCIVTLPNAVNLDVEMEPKEKGQTCLDQVCSRLGIIEEDYFGLQYQCQRGEVLWLNMRNPIRQQVPGPLPYRLHFRVKFFVPPHLLLQEATRHQFYLHVKNTLLEDRVHLPMEHLARLVAYIAQAELGDHVEQTPNCYGLFLSNNGIGLTPEFWETVTDFHETLKGWSRSKSEYWLLKEASSLRGYGEEEFLAKTPNGESVLLGVGPDGVSVYNAETREVINSITYNSINIVTHTGKCFYVDCITDSNPCGSQTLEFKLDGIKTANSVYRTVTEKHVFYSCDTVQRSVTTQFIRDLKGTIISLFNEHSALGKNYVFDVRSTCREVYDKARRQLHTAASQQSPTGQSDGLEVPKCRRHSHRKCSVDQDDYETPDDEVSCKNASCLALQERLVRLEDAILCRVCMDVDIDTMFLPCSHITCCNNCALLCDTCPICRANIEKSQFVYLPFVTDKNSSLKNKKTIGNGREE